VELCVGSRLCLAVLLEGGRGVRNCVLRADCVSGFGKRVGREGCGGFVC